MSDIDRMLHQVTRPGRYTGGEWNSVRKDWDVVDVKVALAYPDAYEIGMSNMGLMILYDLLNQKPEILAERVFAPWIDMATEMRRNSLPLFSLESKRPLNEFDIIGFSLSYELTCTNVLNMLDLSGIPMLASEREDLWPLVIAGGTCAVNPEPMSDFIDLFVIGEGEEVILELVEELRRSKLSGIISKQDLLVRLAQIKGVYVPSMYEVRYGVDGRFDSIVAELPDIPNMVERRIVNHLPLPVTRPVVPFVEVTHDRAAVEIQRGCTRGCRFCQASVVYRPVRERPIDEVVSAVDEIVQHCGYEEVSLLSLSTSDYSCISELVRSLAERNKGQHLALSLPSLRPDAFSVDLAKSIQGQRKTSLTFAPEAGTERLRNVINKGVTEEDLLEAVSCALDNGWRSLKLYFMVGLPTETEDDVAGIVDLVRRARQVKGPNGKKANIKVNVSTFIPKAHTPFQWVAQCTGDELSSKHDILRMGLRKVESKLSWHDPNVSLLEGVMARGDRRLGEVILHAWHLGCAFDAWSDLFDHEKWLQAFDECGIDPMDYIMERSQDEVMPWSHIETGVSIDFLKREFERALAGEKTPDCRWEICSGCGLQRWDEGCRGRNLD